jgi:hypothetical protein
MVVMANCKRERAIGSMGNPPNRVCFYQGNCVPKRVIPRLILNDDEMVEPNHTILCDKCECWERKKL